MSVPVIQPPRREPVFNIPAVIAGLIAILVIIHAIRSRLAPDVDFQIVLDFAFIPARLMLGLSPSEFGEALARTVAGLPPDMAQMQVALGRLLYEEGTSNPWTFLSYAFLHGSWMHLLLNCAWLLAFGTPVARRFGLWRFLAFFCVCAIAGAVAHFITGRFEVMPMVGASGAISGCMAAAVRFIFQTHPAHPGLSREHMHLMPAPGLLEGLMDRRVFLFVLIWFGSNLLFGILARPLGITDSAIAWQAHIGGFLAGLLLFPLFDPVARA